jgi:hypothetical protein
MDTKSEQTNRPLLKLVVIPSQSENDNPVSFVS